MKYIVVCATYNQDASMYVDSAEPFDNVDDAAKFVVDDWDATLVKVFEEKPLDFDSVKQKIEAMKLVTLNVGSLTIHTVSMNIIGKYLHDKGD